MRAKIAVAMCLLASGCVSKKVHKADSEALTYRIRAVERRVKYIEFILAHGDPISDESWKVE